MGQIECLNVTGGDIKISFDNSNAAEAIRAKRVITDMLRRGYALLVKMEDGSYSRAAGFDYKTGEYIIADFDPTQEQPAEPVLKKETSYGEPPKAESAEPEIQVRKPGRTIKKRVKIESTSAVAVARSAGG